MTTVTVHSPLKVGVPRAALWVSAAMSGLLAWAERRAAQRAERRRLDERMFEAAAVREYAQRFVSHDPRFAADLLAAADRHENTK